MLPVTVEPERLAFRIPERTAPARGLSDFRERRVPEPCGHLYEISRRAEACTNWFWL